MTQDKTGGPAFPNSVQPDFQWAESGMTLRDWFAGQALAGILANPARLDNLVNTTEGAYTIADAMIKSRGNK